MFNVVAPGRIVLTLQSIPPFAVETIIALTLTVLLAVPLIGRLQFLAEPVKSRKPSPRPCRSRRWAERSYDCDGGTVLMHRPGPIFIDSAGSSSINLHPESASETVSTPILRANGDTLRNAHRSAPGEKVFEKGNGPTSDQPFSMVGGKLAVIDMPALDYESYRHRLIEATLRRQYDDYQPPGNVVLNCIHLNNVESAVGGRRNQKHGQSFFDFVGEYYDEGVFEAKRVQPLDHFLVKGTEKPEQTEKETETSLQRIDAYHDLPAQGAPPNRLLFARSGTTLSDTSTIRKRHDRHNNSHDQSVLKSKTLNNRRERSKFYPYSMQASETGSKSPSKGPDKSPKTRELNITESARNETSKDGLSTADPEASKKNDPGSSKNVTHQTKSTTRRKIMSKSGKANSNAGLLGLRSGSIFESREEGQVAAGSKSEGESANYTSASSARSESVCSDKFRDENSCRSRDSSLTSERNRSVGKSQPWMAGTSQCSFNRKYGNTSKPAFRVRGPAAQRNAPLKRWARFDRLAVLPANRDAASAKLELNETPPRKMHRSRRTAESSRKNEERVQDQRLERIESSKQEDSETIVGTRDNLVNDSQHETPFGAAPKETSSGRSRTMRSGLASKLVKGRSPDSTNNRLSRDNALSGDSECPGNFSSKQVQSRKLPKLLHSAKQLPRTLGHPTAKDDSLSGRTKISTGIKRAFYGDQISFTKDDKTANRGEILERDENVALCDKLGTDDVHNAAVKNGKTLKGGNARVTVHGKAGNNQNFTRASSKFNSRFLPAKLTDSTKENPINPERNTESNGARYTEGSGSRKCSTGASRERKAKEKPGEQETSVEGSAERLPLPRRSSRIGVAMQSGLRKYIKKLKRVLTDRDTSDITALASLSLTDAILPDLEFSLSPGEIQQLQNLLNTAEGESEMARVSDSIEKF